MKDKIENVIAHILLTYFVLFTIFSLNMGCFELSSICSRILQLDIPPVIFYILGFLGLAVFMTFIQIKEENK